METNEAASQQPTEAASQQPDQSFMETRSVIFVHFIPPPLREAQKKHLAWIVHTCNGTGCREATHVTMKSIDGFSTFEGAPPDQTCKCCVAKHHLRGRGVVTWKNEEAIIEGDIRAETMINASAYRDDAKRLKTELSKARRTIRHLREQSHLSAVRPQTYLGKFSRSPAKDDPTGTGPGSEPADGDEPSEKLSAELASARLTIEQLRAKEAERLRVASEDKAVAASEEPSSWDMDSPTFFQRHL